MLDKFLPPTENLYKFLSISGLLLIVISFYPSYLNFRLSEQRIEHFKNQKSHIVDIEEFTEELARKNQITDDARGKLSAARTKINESEQLTLKIEQAIKNNNFAEANNILVQKKEISKEADNLVIELQALSAELVTSDYIKEINERKKQQDLKNVELEATTELMKYYESEISYLQFLSRLLFFLGLVLTPVGFYFWFERVQKYNDLILKAQSQEKTFSKTENLQSNSISSESEKKDS